MPREHFLSDCIVPTIKIGRGGIIVLCESVFQELGLALVLSEALE